MTRRAVQLHLWMHEPPPPEYIELLLCRLYHCPPPMVRDIPLATAMAHLAIVEVEQEYVRRQTGR